MEQSRKSEKTLRRISASLAVATGLALTACTGGGDHDPDNYLTNNEDVHCDGQKTVAPFEGGIAHFYVSNDASKRSPQLNVKITEEPDHQYAIAVGPVISDAEGNTNVEFAEPFTYDGSGNPDMTFRDIVDDPHTAEWYVDVQPKIDSAILWGTCTISLASTPTQG